MATTASRRTRRLSRVPNALTLSRLVLAPALIWALSVETATGCWIALGVFIVAALTDWLDGWMARRLGLTSAFGMFWDPLADKVLIASALFTFLWLNVVPVWMVVVIIAREFIVTSVRVLARAQGRSLPAMREGKQKMLSQTIAVIGTLAILCVRATIAATTGRPWDTWLIRRGPGGAALAAWMDRLPHLLLLVATALSLYSGALFLWRHRRLIAPR